MPLPADKRVNGAAVIGPLHMLKMAVGIGDVDELRRFRAARLKERGASWVYTRNHPRRAEDVLAGGSIYWVIRGQIRVRQLVTGFRSERDENGRGFCLIEVDPDGRDPVAAVAPVSGLALSDPGRRTARPAGRDPASRRGDAGGDAG